MSTNGVIARATGESKFAGRYHHWDSQPHSLGVYLVELYRNHFRRDLNAMLEVLIDKHPAGWSMIVDKNFKLKPGWTSERVKTPSIFEGKSEAQLQAERDAYRRHPDICRPQCYCHGDRHEEEQTLTEADDIGPWAYVFDTLTEEKILHVLHRETHKDSGEGFWNDVGRIELDSDASIAWTEFECGKEFERCVHTAKLHGVNSPLSMRAYLGLESLDFRDAIGFIIHGKRYQATGSGGRSDYFNQTRGTSYSKLSWISTVVAGNGRRVDVPTAMITETGYKPYPGVSWIWPATKANPRETLVSLKQAELFPGALSV